MPHYLKYALLSPSARWVVSRHQAFQVKCFFGPEPQRVDWQSELNSHWRLYCIPTSSTSSTFMLCDSLIGTHVPFSTSHSMEGVVANWEGLRVKIQLEVDSSAQRSADVLAFRVAASESKLYPSHSRVSQEGCWKTWRDDGMFEQYLRSRDASSEHRFLRLFKHWWEGTQWRVGWMPQDLGNTYHQDRFCICTRQNNKRNIVAPLLRHLWSCGTSMVEHRSLASGTAFRESTWITEFRNF